MDNKDEVIMENETEATEVQKEKFSLKDWAGKYKKQLAIGGGIALAAIGGFVLKALGKDETSDSEPEEDEEEESYGTGEDAL